MKGAIANLRTGWASRASWIVVPAVLSILSVAGVVAPPLISLSKEELLRGSALRRAADCEAERADHERFEKAHGFEQIRAAEAQVDRLVPKDFSAVDVHAALRLFARSHAVELRAINFVSTQPTDLPVLADRVVMSEVNLVGTGALSGWIGLVEEFQKSGHPCRLLELSMGRARAVDVRFEVRLSLGLYHTEPLPAEESAGTKESL